MRMKCIICMMRNNVYLYGLYDVFEVYDMNDVYNVYGFTVI